MREGYKMTELGEIPKDWEFGKFADYTKVNQGLQIAISKRLKHKKEGYYRYITIQFIKKPNEEGNIYYVKPPSNSVICTKEEILMTRTGNTGIVVTNVEGVFHNNFFKVDYNKNEFDKDFLFFYLNSKPIQDLIKLYAGGTTIPDLNHSEFYKIPLLKPQYIEQQKIAKILSCVDEKIAHIEEQIQATQDLKKGLMQNLLTKGIGHTEFKKSVLGEIPKDWEVKELKDFCKCFVGIASSATHAYTNKGILLIRNQNIKEGKLDLKDVLFVTPEYELLHKSKRLKSGDIVTVRTGYPGISAVVPKELENCQSFTTLIIRQFSSNAVTSDYLCYYINSEEGKNFFKSSQAGGGQKNVGTKTLERMNIPLPPHPEQQKIAQILSCVDGKLEVLGEKKGLYLELKKGLMQELLTGRVRVQLYSHVNK